MARKINSSLEDIAARMYHCLATIPFVPTNPHHGEWADEWHNSLLAYEAWREAMANQNPNQPQDDDQQEQQNQPPSEGTDGNPNPGPSEGDDNPQAQ